MPLVRRHGAINDGHHHCVAYMTTIMLLSSRNTSGDRDESEQGTGRPEPGTDRRGGSPVIPRAWLRRDRRRGSDERGGAHAWRVLRTLLLEGGTDRGGLCPRAGGLPGGLERARRACVR